MGRDAFGGTRIAASTGPALGGRALSTTVGSSAQAGSTRHAGSVADRTGTNRIATIASIQTRCRVAAESRLKRAAATAASPRSTVALTAESRMSRRDAPATARIERLISAALLLCALDERDQPLA